MSVQLAPRAVPRHGGRFFPGAAAIVLALFAALFAAPLLIAIAAGRL